MKWVDMKTFLSIIHFFITFIALILFAFLCTKIFLYSLFYILSLVSGKLDDMQESLTFINNFVYFSIRENLYFFFVSMALFYFLDFIRNRQ